MRLVIENAALPASERQDRLEPPPLRGDDALAEAAELRLKIFELSAEAERLRNTVSYQLGGAILRARRWSGLLDLPREIGRLIAVSRQRRGRRAMSDPSHSALDLLLRRLLGPLHDAEVHEVLAAVEAEGFEPRYRAFVLAEIAGLMRFTAPDKSLELLRAAVALDPSPTRQATLAVHLYDAGRIEEPRAIFARLGSRRNILSQSAQHKAMVLEGMARVRDNGVSIPARRATPRVEPRESTVLYLAASSAPYHTTGYTARTQSLIKALRAQGWRAEAATRSGYPRDRNDIHHIPKGRVQEADGIAYSLLPGPPANRTAFDRYCAEASRAVLTHIERVRPAVVHAASNYLNATPALIAARQAGLPFVYEVRGLWELTHAAKDPRFEGSERFVWQKEQESRVAHEADVVVTLSQGLKRELVARGVDESRILLAPNCVDPDLFKPVKRDEALARDLRLGDAKVIGFIGSMMAYEGLVDLVEALARLRTHGRDVCAVLVGDGPAARQVREAARSFGVQAHVIMPGRVPPADVRRWYSLMDLAVYPRRPSGVTELVPPLKPLEALAMGVPVVASDVAAIAETIEDEANGFLFRRGDIDSLTARLDHVLTHERAARRTASAGRKSVMERFTWTSTATRLVDAYRELRRD